MLLLPSGRIHFVLSFEISEMLLHAIYLSQLESCSSSLLFSFSIRKLIERIVYNSLYIRKSVQIQYFHLFFSSLSNSFWLCVCVCFWVRNKLNQTKQKFVLFIMIQSYFIRTLRIYNSIFRRKLDIHSNSRKWIYSARNVNQTDRKRVWERGKGFGIKC